MDKVLNDSGQIDFDKLNPEERDYYMKALEQVSQAEMTLEDWKQFVGHLREAVETSLVDEPEYIYSLPLPFLKRKNPKFTELKMRLKDLLIFERYLVRPEMAKKVLEEYNKKLGIK